MRCINEDKSVIDEDKDITFIAGAVKGASQLDLMFSGTEDDLEALHPRGQGRLGAHKADHGVNST